MKYPTEDSVSEILKAAKFSCGKMGSKTAVVTATLSNGFDITVSASAANPEKYDQAIGELACTQKLRDSVFRLEAYRLAGSPFS